MLSLDEAIYPLGVILDLENLVTIKRCRKAQLKGGLCHALAGLLPFNKPVKIPQVLLEITGMYHIFSLAMCPLKTFSLFV